jgi:hypothetical protein
MNNKIMCMKYIVKNFDVNVFFVFVYFVFWFGFTVGIECLLNIIKDGIQVRGCILGIKYFDGV